MAAAAAAATTTTTVATAMMKKHRKQSNKCSNSNRNGDSNGDTNGNSDDSGGDTMTAAEVAEAAAYCRSCLFDDVESEVIFWMVGGIGKVKPPFTFLPIASRLR